MADVVLNYSGDVINDALGKVANATTAPVANSDNMITSGGVAEALAANAQIATGAHTGRLVTFTEFPVSVTTKSDLDAADAVVLSERPAFGYPYDASIERGSITASVRLGFGNATASVVFSWRFNPAPTGPSLWLYSGYLRLSESRKDPRIVWLIDEPVRTGTPFSSGLSYRLTPGTEQGFALVLRRYALS